MAVAILWSGPARLGPCVGWARRGSGGRQRPDQVSGRARARCRARSEVGIASGSYAAASGPRVRVTRIPRDRRKAQAPPPQLRPARGPARPTGPLPLPLAGSQKRPRSGAASSECPSKRRRSRHQHAALPGDITARISPWRRLFQAGPGGGTRARLRPGGGPGGVGQGSRARREVPA